MTPALGMICMCCVLYVLFVCEKGDHVHVGDMWRVWWWKSGLTGLTSTLLPSVVSVPCSLSFSPLQSGFCHSCFLEIQTFESRAVETMRTEMWRQFTLLWWTCMSGMLNCELSSMFDPVLRQIMIIFSDDATFQKHSRLLRARDAVIDQAEESTLHQLWQCKVWR